MTLPTEGQSGHLQKHADIDTLIAGHTSQIAAGDVTNPASAAGVAIAGRFVKPLAGSGTLPVAPLAYINAADFGAVGDNTGDQSAAIQAALNAAGSGGVVKIPAGIYQCATTITVPAWCTLEANSGAFGAGGTSPVELRFAISGATVALTLGTYATLRNLKVRGPGTAVGTCKGITAASATFENVSVINFATGTHITAGYYAMFNRCEWSRNGTALLLTSCYNVNLYVPLFYCGSTVDDSPGNAIVGTARGLNIFGGSIEGYRAAVTMNSAEALGMYGVYFETKVDANAFAIQAVSLAKITITAVGCMVYLNGHNRWIDTGNSTDVALVAHSNHFVAVTGSVQVPIGYVISPDQAIVLGPDNWSEVVKAGSTYVSPTAGGLPCPGATVTMPAGSTTGPIVYDGRRVRNALQVQNLAVAGAVVIDSKRGDSIVNLTANATSSTISNAPTIAQELSITWLQDATGGRTYVWPTSCRFAGGVAPSDTTLNTLTIVQFRYNTSTGRWVEISRAVAVPV